ncbi:MAG: alpha-hydroxy acid oxidase [Acidimicrobiia bacterium]
MKPTEIASLLRPRRPILRPSTRRLARCQNIEDLRRAARRRLPRPVFDYVEGGAEDEITLHRNTEAFDDLVLTPRVLRDVDAVDLSTTILGEPSPLPLALAPTGFTRMTHHEGELAVARSAQRAGIPYTLSTMGTRSIERVAAESSGSLWFQLYVWRDRGLAKELIERAKAAGYRALVLTVDVPVPGARERDLRNGLTIPPSLGVRTFFEGARHPHWWWNFLMRDAVSFECVSDRAADPSGVMALLAEQFDPSVTWNDLDWIHDAWDGPFVLKGIVDADDARRAADAGVTGVVVSNHGGRQLDRGPAAIAALPAVVEAVGDRLDVLFDSGIRRGRDILTALALGARACLVGRAYLYGLGVAGERGVDRAIELLTGELRRSMQLVGARTVSELEPSMVAPLERR